MLYDGFVKLKILKNYDVEDVGVEVSKICKQNCVQVEYGGEEEKIMVCGVCECRKHCKGQE